MMRIAREITRFQSKKTVDQLFKKARRVVTHPGLHILLAPTTAQIGHILIITARSVGNAPTRNKVRRQLRALFYQEQLFARGYDCIIIAKPGCSSLSYTTIRALVFKAFARSSPV